jgi:N-acetylglucosamine malate deacetylase 2
MPLDLNCLKTRTVALVVAHPDDETVGAGALLAELRDATIVHVTDGSPVNPADAQAAGCATPREYGQVRRVEMLAALRLAGLDLRNAREIGVRDQEASLRMAPLARRLCRVLGEIGPAVVLTHPYEGGHPDHDATAFAIHAACAKMPEPPVIVEFACYHGLYGYMKTGEFLPSPSSDPLQSRAHEGAEIIEVPLPEPARRLKESMLDCFTTQRETLRAFSAGVERFRFAPRYRFTEPPHEGTLNYERFEWGMTGERFRALAGRALAELGLEDGL